ncbi:Phage tail protein [Salinibacterium sp. NYA9b]
MAEIAVVPIVMKDVVLEIEDDDFAAAVSSAMLTPSSSSVVFKGLKADAVFTDVTAATWTLALTFAQDWATAGSLSLYLFNNEGAVVDAVLKPQSGIGPSFAVEIVITPGAIGGAVDTTATATVTLGVQGKPTLVPAV